jgi:hypothetical protein
MIECSFWFRLGVIKNIKVKSLEPEITVAAPPGLSGTLFVRCPQFDTHAGLPVYVSKKWIEASKEKS